MTTDATSSTELVRRLVNEVWNAGRTEAVTDLLAPEFTGHGYGPVPLDREGYAAFAGEHREKLPDLTLTIEDVLEEDDRVAVRWTRSGTPEQPVMGVEPDGTRLSVPGATFYRIEDGRIAEAWNVRDTGAVLKQLGLAPERSTE